MLLHPKVLEMNSVYGPETAALDLSESLHGATTKTVLTTLAPVDKTKLTQPALSLYKQLTNTQTWTGRKDWTK